MDELKQIDAAMASGRIGKDGQIAQQFFIDALVISGTRNTVALLVEKILRREILEGKAAQTLKAGLF